MTYPTINYITKPPQKQPNNLFKILFCFTFSILFGNISLAQNHIIEDQFIPPLDSLKNQVVKFYQCQALAQIEQYQYKTKANWLNYIPSPGWNFTVNAPVLSYNLSELYQAVNAKRSRRATLKAIIALNEVQLNLAWSEIALLRETLLNRVQAYNASLELLTLHQTKFQIIEKGFTQSEITPSEFLTARLTLATFTNDLRKEYSTLFQLRNELLIKSKKGERLSLSDVLNETLNRPVK